MKPLIHILILISINIGFCYSQDEPTELTVTKKTNSFKIENMTFKVHWDDSLSYSDNIGYYGGIKTLDVYKDEKHLQTLKHIEDKIALGYIIFRFEDFNLDGWLDFRIPLNEKYPMYYLFNPETKAYQRAEDWDYLRDYKVDTDKKQITTNSYDFLEVTTYKIQDLKLIEIK